MIIFGPYIIYKAHQEDTRYRQVCESNGGYVVETEYDRHCIKKDHMVDVK